MIDVLKINCGLLPVFIMNCSTHVELSVQIWIEDKKIQII